MPFTTPAREDGAVFLHWRRAAEEAGKDERFSRIKTEQAARIRSRRTSSIFSSTLGRPQKPTASFTSAAALTHGLPSSRTGMTANKQFTKRSVDDLEERCYLSWTEFATHGQCSAQASRRPYTRLRTRDGGSAG